METNRTRRRAPTDLQPPPPSPNPNPSSLLRDVSNFKTPKPRRPFKTPNPSTASPLFFTSTKNTPSTSALTTRRTSHPKAARRLKALELEQSQSSRKVQVRREKELECFNDAVTAWLNFLFRNPGACGCGVGNGSGGGRSEGLAVASGKRESLECGGGIGVDGGWRNPKRQRSSVHGEEKLVVSKVALAVLQFSLQDVCSFEDLKERMQGHLSKKGCGEVLLMMSRVSKSIDDGRLRMKAHCPIVSDVRLRKKAVDVLMCYNRSWLQIGLHIILGGDSLLTSGEGNSVDDTLLRMIIEKQFFSHTHLAKSYAFNKLVEGVFRPGYFEALGNIILKRFVLLVILLDKTKCESMIPLKYGIDGIDGGSPLLFCRHSHIKSSRQLLLEFLSEAMHGEGDLLAHLTTLGYKVTYQQSPLTEYDFHVTDLCEDLQDGVLLCRAIQLLQCDASILSKVVTPSDTHKKNMQNCGIAMQYLRQAGVPLSDGDGVLILADDIAKGDKELILSILWNMFVNLQIPLLIDRTLLLEEIAKVKGVDIVISKYADCTNMELLLEWIQAVCEIFHIKINKFAALVDGKALSCLINYYFRDELPGSHAFKESAPSFPVGESIFLSDADNNVACNFFLVQQVTTVLGKFPMVLHMSDLLGEGVTYDERSVVVLLIFLSSTLLNRRNMDHLDVYKLFQLNHQNHHTKLSAAPQLQNKRNSLCSYPENCMLKFDTPSKLKLHKYQTEEWAAQVLQSRFRGLVERKNFRKMKTAVILLQHATRAWLVVLQKQQSNDLAKFDVPSSSGTYHRYLKVMIERHRFLQIKKAVQFIQQAVRIWIKQKRVNKSSLPAGVTAIPGIVTVATTIQSCTRGHITRSRYALMSVQSQKFQPLHGEAGDYENQRKAATKLQKAWRKFMLRRFLYQQQSAATIIQKFWHGWRRRREFLSQMGAVIKIQGHLRGLVFKKAFKEQKAAAIEIQRAVRGQLTQKKLLGASSIWPYRSSFRVCGLRSHSENIELNIVMNSVLKLQRWWKKILLNKSRTCSAIIIQSFIRQWIAQRKALMEMHNICYIQRWWRNTLFLKLRERSAITIQSHFRGWVARRRANRERNCIVVIQSYWKGYLVRKDSRPCILDLRCRLKLSSANIDNDMRLINRLVTALSELLDHKSISNIRITCATLNMATQLSQKCCETLVSAGAINILLMEINSLTRSGPDQEVVKHIISTLNSISRYPHLARVLISVPRSVETIFQELLRNKNEGYFVACDLLRKLGETADGLQGLRALHGHIKRLKALVQYLEGKAKVQKRLVHLGAARRTTEQRLKAATGLLQMIKATHC